jgi:hypothetical protein
LIIVSDAANDGDRLVVNKGIYPDPITVEKNIEIVGNDFPEEKLTNFSTTQKLSDNVKNIVICPPNGLVWEAKSSIQKSTGLIQVLFKYIYRERERENVLFIFSPLRCV